MRLKKTKNKKQKNKKNLKFSKQNCYVLPVKGGSGDQT